ncbi:MAG: Na+ dependent nucleoside transporter [Bacteroidetes bacterium GWF2_33_16]|nr:MAG: Na+ dependent nucleoside transporter [Bacteroidetes bacterium GWE2_32_14]OFY05298.1 MAG: Na+ dependent nucleoside transporter [Bacteroidetes bacterium GWF2_33_16]
MKKFLILFSLIVISAGVIIGFTSGVSKNESNQTDTVTVVSESASENSQPDSVEQIQEEPAKSTILLKGSEKTGFSFITILRGLLGMLVLVSIAWLFSANRKGVDWFVIAKGLAIQLILAICILYLPFIAMFFEIVGKMFVKILDFTKVGSEFLFGSLMDMSSVGMIFAFQILPTIIFFSALTSVLFYWGIIQIVVKGLAWLMIKAMKLSGTESLSVAGNIFLGQTEAPLMIKAYLPKMNDSEMLLVMIGGMATVAGGVLAAYIGFLGGDDPIQRVLFAKHLLTASVMAAPGAIVISKILMPQTEKIKQEMDVSMDKIGSNFLDALSNGTIEGLKLAANVGAMLLVFFAFLAMINFVFLKVGAWTNLNESITSLTNGQYTNLSLQFILGYTFAPLMWVIGVCKEDITLLGQLLGEKLIASEFVGYTSLANLKAVGTATYGSFTQFKSVIMATYMLCGFANFASIGIQIGGIGGLAPNKRGFLSKQGMRALLGGTLASLLSATIIGMILG